MAGFLIRSDFHDRPQVIQLNVSEVGASAIGTWLLCLAWMHRRRHPRSVITREHVASLPDGQTHAVALVAIGLWAEVNDGYVPCRYDQDGEVLWKRELPPSRPPIDPQVRAAVFDRDQHRCALCPAIADLTLDHIFPWSLGGADSIENLRVLCRPCNSRKGARV